MLALSTFSRENKNMSKIQDTGFAYGNILPLCAVDENGKVDRNQTLNNIATAIETWPEVSQQIPESERRNVWHQISGAAISWVG
jgi:hypothetical protein